MTNPNPHIHTALALHPEMAQQVGLVMAEYAILERLLFTIYALISQHDPRVCFRRFYKLRALNDRRKLVEAAARKSNLHARLQRALKRLLNRFEGAADRRTEIAHCTYLSDATTLVRLRTIKGEPKYEVISATIFARTFSQYHNLSTDMLTFCGLIASIERVREINQAIPRAPELRPGPDIHGMSRDEVVEETKASITRLGLTVSDADVLLLAAAGN